MIKIQEENLEEKFLLALSGGVDSVVLFHLLCESCKDLNKFHVVHFNHKLRSESEEEYVAMEELCSLTGVTFHGVELDVEAYMEANKLSMETSARELRYLNFERIALEEGIKNIYLGHHGDDLVETVFMRIVKGSHTKGLIGMSKEHTVNELTYHRPLLEVTKAEIIAEADSKGYKYFTDLSNTDEKITRNRYRSNLLPFVKQENTKVHEAILTFSTEKKEDEEFFDLMVKEAEKNMLNNHVLLGYSKEYLNNSPKALRKRVFNSLVKTIMGDDYIYSNNLLDNIMDFYTKQKTSLAVELSKDLLVISDQNNVWFVNKQELAEYKKSVADKIGLQPLVLSDDNNKRLNGKRLTRLFSDLKVAPFFREGYVDIQNDTIIHVYNTFGELIR